MEKFAKAQYETMNFIGQAAIPIPITTTTTMQGKMLKREIRRRRRTPMKKPQIKMSVGFHISNG